MYNVKYFNLWNSYKTNRHSPIKSTVKIIIFKFNKNHLKGKVGKIIVKLSRRKRI